MRKKIRDMRARYTKLPGTKVRNMTDLDNQVSGHRELVPVRKGLLCFTIELRVIEIVLMIDMIKKDPLSVYLVATAQVND
jgi:hypothetical protein